MSFIGNTVEDYAMQRRTSTSESSDSSYVDRWISPSPYAAKAISPTVRISVVAFELEAIVVVAV